LFSIQEDFWSAACYQELLDELIKIRYEKGEMFEAGLLLSWRFRASEGGICLDGYEIEYSEWVPVGIDDLNDQLLSLPSIFTVTS
jgi:hypothetical protein